MCRAMVRCDEYLSELPNHFTIMQVHDELVFDFPKGRTPTANLPKVLKLKALMEESGKDIGVPLKVDYAYHPHNWAKKAPLDLGVAA
jgi:DNA polymerase I-like protein with 3'-5' exonuclease and polymerase domains